MKSGHDAREFVKNHVFVDQKLTIFEGEKNTGKELFP